MFARPSFPAFFSNIRKFSRNFIARGASRTLYQILLDFGVGYCMNGHQKIRIDSKDPAITCNRYKADLRWCALFDVLFAKVSTSFSEIFSCTVSCSVIHIKLFVNLTHSWIRSINVFFIRALNSKTKHFLCIVTLICCKPGRSR